MREQLLGGGKTYTQFPALKKYRDRTDVPPCRVASSGRARWSQPAWNQSAKHHSRRLRVETPKGMLKYTRITISPNN